MTARSSGHTHETSAHAATSAIMRGGDNFTGADSDRSGLTTVAIQLIHQDTELRNFLIKPENYNRSPWSAEEVEQVMGSSRIAHIAHESGQTPNATEEALCEVLPMLGRSMAKKEGEKRQPM
ncbi:hypothetical protein [Kozakia baliensis]|uniref:hypothetical protein n=1 Tax=Kozakia baliensis TaxID=153496 RepID=UPI00124766CF|nr:hypothetical protein [Kozakia baliensis]